MGGICCGDDTLLLQVDTPTLLVRFPHGRLPWCGVMWCSAVSVSASLCRDQALHLFSLHCSRSSHELSLCLPFFPRTHTSTASPLYLRLLVCAAFALPLFPFFPLMLLGWTLVLSFLFPCPFLLVSPSLLLSMRVRCFGIFFFLCAYLALRLERLWLHCWLARRRAVMGGYTRSAQVR